SAFTIADSYPETQFQITLPPDPTVRGKFNLSLLVAPVSASDPNGANPFGGSGARFAFKYIYTLTNLTLSVSAIDCIYLFDVSNCIDLFAAFDPKNTNGTTKANWEHNTWTASPPTNSVNWNIKATANPKTDGICSTASGSNPDTVLTFCVYTDRPP